MLILPGGIGDQQINGARAAALGLAECVGRSDGDQEAAVTKWRSLQSGDHRQALRAFKAMGNYTHTMASAAEGLERLARAKG
jgi:hypothetical protein